MYSLRTTNKFEKDSVLRVKRGLSLDVLEKAVNILITKGVLPLSYKQHKLKGDYSGH